MKKYVGFLKMATKNKSKNTGNLTSETLFDKNGSLISLTFSSDDKKVSKKGKSRSNKSKKNKGKNKCKSRSNKSKKNKSKRKDKNKGKNKNKSNENIIRVPSLNTTLMRKNKSGSKKNDEPIFRPTIRKDHKNEYENIGEFILEEGKKHVDKIKKSQQSINETKIIDDSKMIKLDINHSIGSSRISLGDCFNYC